MTAQSQSVLRDMIETASDFKEYIRRYGIARSEGTLPRYLSDAWRVLDRTIPTSKYDERLEDIAAWLGLMVRTVDSSLVDEWSGTTSEEIDAGAAPQATNQVVKDRRGLTLLVRNALFLRVRLAALGRTEDLGQLDADWGWREGAWKRALDAFYEVHDEILLDGDARSSAFLQLMKQPRRLLTFGMYIKSSMMPMVMATLAFGRCGSGCHPR